MTLETRRLRLRPFALSDAEDHGRMYANPEVTQFLAGGPFASDEARHRSSAAVHLFVSHWRQHGFGVWAVLDKTSGALIGQCGLKYLPASPEVEILYAFDTPYWGQGLATEAASAALHHGFEAVGLERILAVARPDHGASRRVMEKLGMVFTRADELFGMPVVVYTISRDHHRGALPISRATIA
jgi:ribosomal-protein-alanine N-acetyltransferase